ncbi:hypothetical protein SAMN02910315_00428 [Methanobrevibacter millerae]|uniref:Uncharacterized protein n=1 Tax=Methanobrevibacter millerae TaxID=230361 RepID=A0A1G5V7A0_9EURY|nr:hypothetical protein SAMN02910315_00428 [Methanobrevibacter millerae]
MLKFYDLNEFPKTLITEEKNIIICSERKVVDNFVTIGITIIACHQLFIIISASYPQLFQ